MPVFGIGLHVLIALFFAVHAIRNRQNNYWLFILFAFPGLGSVAYFFAIYLPDLRHSRGARNAARALVNIIDPTRELRAAEKAFDLTPTVGNRIRLATALLETGAHKAALEQYQQAANGPFAIDPELLIGMARIWLELDEPHRALEELEKLFATYPQRRQHTDLALYYARALAGSGSDHTRTAFDLALKLASGPEVKCRYADWLTARHNAADHAQAHALYEEVIADRRYWDNRNTLARHREWLEHARQALAVT
ncbi:hypothetical protein AGMMS50225_00640 [Betaproteobacteria bacterium]|nr:hypothetical protein AGMMS50225_00640 [Betaproteobacteria bacterium]